MAGLSDGQQEMFETYQRYRRLRREHLRRTRFVHRRLFPGVVLEGVLGVLFWMCPVALLLATLARIDLMPEREVVAGVALGALALLALGLGGRAIKNARPDPIRHARYRIFAKLVFAGVGAMLVAVPTAAVVFGGLLFFFGLYGGAQDLASLVSRSGGQVVGEA